MRIFGVNVSIIEPPDIEDYVDLEEQDEQADIEAANEALFAEEGTYSDTVPYGFYAPPPQKIWWRV